MTTLKRILLIEDDPKDIELTLSALDEYNLANEVVTARDGVEALDYLPPGRLCPAPRRKPDYDPARSQNAPDGWRRNCAATQGG